MQRLAYVLLILGVLGHWEVVWVMHRWYSSSLGYPSPRWHSWRCSGA